MAKTLSFRQVAALKRTAQNNYPNVAKVEKLKAKIAEMQEEINILNAQIEGAEMGSKALTGGFTSFDLIDREVVSTGKFDKDGRELKMTKYVPKASALKLNDDNSYTILLELQGKLFESPAEEAPTYEAPEITVEDEPGEVEAEPINTADSFNAWGN